MISPNLISVIIPVYNGERYLSEALYSVIDQTVHEIEIIVVDDGSTDNSAETIKQFSDSRIRYIYQSNQGAAAARNHGVSLAQGAFLAFLDADDLWSKGKLSSQLKVMTEHDDADMVFGHMINFKSPELTEDMTTAESVSRPGYVSGTMLIREKSFHKAGFFSTAWHLGEFIEWYSRAEAADLKSHMLTETILKRRIHDCNMGIRSRGDKKDYARIIKLILERRKENLSGS